MGRGAAAEDSAESIYSERRQCRCRKGGKLVCAIFLLFLLLALLAGLLYYFGFIHLPFAIPFLSTTRAYISVSGRVYFSLCCTGAGSASNQAVVLL